MKSNLSLITGAAAFVCLTGITNANLMLTGHTVGVFQPSSGAHTLVSNSADGDASFRTGVPVNGSFMSGVEFNSQDFTDVASGDTLALGTLTYYNGITSIGTSSANAVLDFYLQLSDPDMNWVHLTTMTFGIDATVNTGSNLVPDNYTVSFTQPSDVLIGNEWVKFAINGLPTHTAIAENAWSTLGDVTVTYGTPTPVPEHGTSVAFLGMTFIAIALFGRMHGPSNQSRSRSLVA